MSSYFVVEDGIERRSLASTVKHDITWGTICEIEGAIKPATFRFVTQQLNHCATTIPVLFRSNGNSHTVRTLSSRCVCVYIYIYIIFTNRDAGLGKEKIMGQQ